METLFTGIIKFDKLCSLKKLDKLKKNRRNVYITIRGISDEMVVMMY